jgi:UDP-N-acetylmuramyl pentapeptide phosphotransferase/UDP-N-acetylglucosamine-1-phosphate transferase
MPHALFYTVWCLTAAFGSGVLTRQLIDWARARGVLDIPNARSSHTRVTPRGGGLAIVAVVAIAALLAVILHPESLKAVAGMILPAISIAAISWLDDVHTLNNRTRFSVHLLCAAVSTAFLGPVERVDLGSFGTFDLGIFAWPLTLLWIVGLTNAFNFMDGIDGIAGITALAAGIALAAASGALGATAVGAVAAAMAAASLGFLTWNWQPARIFMGDVGSAFLGFLIAVLPLAVGAEAKPRVVPVAVFVMWPFIFDTAYTIVRRLRNRENIFQAHRSHLYQRLTIAGWSHRAVSRLYGALAAMAGAIGVAPLFDSSLRQSADHAALWTIAIGIILLLALRK